VTQRIVVIDDDRDTLALLERVLSAAGYEVATAESGEDGLLAVTPGRVDCLVVDKFLPRMNGLEVMAEARRRLPGLPVVLLTNNPEPVTFGDARPDAVLARPFADDRAVEEAVAGALESRKKTLANRLTEAVAEISPLRRRR